MGKQRLRNWILNNPFFHYKGQFSKSAFIAINTWVLVLLRYVFAGLNISAGIAERHMYGRIIPAINWNWRIEFNEGASIALLTTCFALYFGGKFSPDNKGGGEHRDMQGEVK